MWSIGLFSVYLSGRIACSYTEKANSLNTHKYTLFFFTHPSVFLIKTTTKTAKGVPVLAKEYVLLQAAP